jgi:hypothetical protein
VGDRLSPSSSPRSQNTSRAFLPFATGPRIPERFASRLGSHARFRLFGHRRTPSPMGIPSSVALSQCRSCGASPVWSAEGLPCPPPVLLARDCMVRAGYAACLFPAGAVCYQTMSRAGRASCSPHPGRAASIHARRRCSSRVGRAGSTRWARSLAGDESASCPGSRRSA